MICTFIVDSENVKHFYEKRDCHIWQPLTLISAETLDYIKNTKNETTRLERFAAYSLLFFAASEIFGVKILRIDRNKNGKPFIAEAKKTHEPREIYFSISHSGDLCAVTLSDEGECGVDIQVEPKNYMAQRIEKRFLSSPILSEAIESAGIFEVKNSLLSEEDSHFCEPVLPGKTRVHKAFIYFAVADNVGFVFSVPQKMGVLFPTLPAGEHSSVVDSEAKKKHNTLKKWTACEAILKCCGGGFGDFCLIEEMALKYVLISLELSLRDRIYSLTVAEPSL